MQKTRVIARLDIKNGFVIKGIHLEGLRKIGDPLALASKYYEEGIDEIVFMDAVASLYDRNNLYHIIKEASRKVFVPITIGGGIRKIEDIQMALRSGADKVAINTQGIKNPDFLKDAVHTYGSQCIVASIESKKTSKGWEAFVDNGREETGVMVLDWVIELQKIGVGEIMLTSIDAEGTKNGFEMELIKAVCERVNIPVIVSGGAGNLKHLSDVCSDFSVDAIAVASVLHYNIHSVPEIKTYLKNANVPIRI